MKTGKAIKDTLLTSTLNDLLQLDVDAVQAYALAIRQLDSSVRKQTLRRYQADHKRHISALKQLIRSHGGVPVALSHIPTGPFKLAMQATGSVGGDRAVLRAFKTNERQVRDKYRRVANQRGLPAGVVRVLKRGAADEERHYRWAEKSLQQLSAGRRTMVGRAAGLMEVANARAVDLIEGAERPLMTAMEATRRGVRAAVARPVRTVVAAAAVAGATGAAAALKGGGGKLAGALRAVRRG
ncbi:MAG TPA: ferritin-like domain-containing protein [Gemmatimonadaceae bacterium]|nr:ferritin-like domain-containing protein [Gemmatimonadaceae bacterium]